MDYGSVLKVEISLYMEMRRSSCAKSTYDHDRKVLESFDIYLQTTGCTTKEITEQHITEWIRTLKGKTSTIAGKVIILRSFLIYLRGYGLSPFIPEIPRVRDDYVPYIYNDDEIQAIINYADNLSKGPVRKNELIHLEMPVILRLMFGCGLRVGETLSLQMKDIDLSKGLLYLHETKNKKQRLVPLHSTMNDILHDYCYAMGMHGKPEAYIFPYAKDKGPLTVKNAKHKFDDILNKNNIILRGRNKHERGPCLHTIRHTYAVRAFKKMETDGILQNDAIPYLSIYLGHDSLNETEKYLKFSSETFPEALDLFENYITSVWPEVSYEK